MTKAPDRARPGRGLRAAIRAGALILAVSLPGLTGLAVLAGPGAAEARSLADTLVTAFRNSPELVAARANVKVQAERAVQARAGGRPRIQGELSLRARLFERDRVAAGFGASSDRMDLVFPNSVALSASQPLYTGGQVENATEAAETRITAQEARLRATEQQVLFDAVVAFMNVRRDAELVDVAQNNVRVITEQLRAARERFEVGEVTRTDVEQARARLAAARSRLAAEQGALAVSRENYLRVVSEPVGELVPPPPLPDLPDSLDAAVALALQSEPTVLAARLEREASGSDVRAAMGALLPQISLDGVVESSDSDISGDTRRLESASVGLFVTVPIWSGGANYSRVREAQAVAERASADITAEMRAAVDRVGRSWADLEVARASIEAGELEVRAAELAFEGITEEAKVGARTTIDVLDAEQDVLTARANLVESRRNEYVAAYAMLAAVGKLTIGHLGLDPDAASEVGGYYQTVRDRNFGYDASDDTVWRFDLRP